MSEDGRTRALAEADRAPTVAEALRAARGDVSQDELATAARALGLNWGRSTVASIETGRREVLAEELLLFPIIVATARGTTPLGLAAILGRGVRLPCATVLRPSGVRAALNGQSVRRPRRELVTQGTPQPPEPETSFEFDVVLAELPDAVHADMRRLWPGASELQLAGAFREGSRDAEIKASRRLKRPPAFVAVAAHALWGRGLTAEREHRLTGSGNDTEPARTRQARRGVITRGLVEDLAAYIADRLGS